MRKHSYSLRSRTKIIQQEYQKETIDSLRGMLALKLLQNNKKDDDRYHGLHM